jgi:hypothetical protein
VKTPIIYPEAQRVGADGHIVFNDARAVRLFDETVQAVEDNEAHILTHEKTCPGRPLNGARLSLSGKPG